MDRSMREDRYSNRRQRENPSFSSTLLDAIYRSIDEGEDELVLYRETMRKTRSNGAAAVHGGGVENDEEMANLRRACLIEKWMEKKVSEKVVVRRKSTADLERKSRGGHSQFPNSSSTSVFLNSSSSSSDSSSGGGFSSSEAESTVFANHKPKPIRTSVWAEPKKLINLNGMDHDIHMFDTFPDVNEQKPKQQNGFVKTKSKAMKIYGDLKKVKQPISPGGRLASFLNSLFTAGNPKKAKISSSTGGYTEKNSDQSSRYSKSTAYTSTCSSASSFSRSCLSKTPSSRGKSSNGVKRSVRFGPVSVVVGEDLQPCGQKSLYKDDLKSEKNRNLIRDSIDGELKLLIMEKNRRVEEVARDLLKNYQKKVESEFNTRNVEEFGIYDEDEDDDDGASCASSDLFELDNLSAIGIERYREELPVYETTHFDTNRAIAKGLIC
ncbi:protein BIG GRAIN 1-like A [Rhododendron vialii]|uniref:protein BIG GRAIN 1-like A n=1 Tax=Rhododendron vialii TaxID=182163 RepID=UPI00265FEB00|nr:protein BIG GRAIN 1-like A [Rhododendron vialii]